MAQRVSIGVVGGHPHLHQAVRQAVGDKVEVLVVPIRNSGRCGSQAVAGRVRRAEVVFFIPGYAGHD